MSASVTSEWPGDEQIESRLIYHTGRADPVKTISRVSFKKVEKNYDTRPFYIIRIWMSDRSAHVIDGHWGSVWLEAFISYFTKRGFEWREKIS